MNPDLRSRWLSGDALKVGAELLEPLTPADRAHRASAVLEVCLGAEPAPEPLRKVLEISHNPDRWPEAHSAFQAVRDLTLAEERSRTSQAYYCLLFVAENAAKTVYNASDPVGPFDSDSPFWLARCARQFVSVVGDKILEDGIWNALTGEGAV